MTQSQIKWASRHDWFMMDLGKGKIMVRDSWTGYDSVMIWAGTFRQLKVWAGY